MARSRLTPEREAELYGAVLDLLREVGYDALTMDAVATRTRSSKATLYRQWGGKPELVARALRFNKPGGDVDIDTGSLRGDFLAFTEIIDDCQVEKDSALLRSLVHVANENPELLQALRELLIEPELNHLRAIMLRAVERGELPPDHPAIEYVPHMLVGAFVARPLIEDRPVSRSFFLAYINAVVLPTLGV
ncbi:TetR/AcrR family transcriptional regulator [Streptomyces hebeiensis]|uniref:TetR/AcrR family transcriptional regulator n=1 Tax=Streptomyces hebeiensis TaxID=229486 RepID=A0ABP4FMS7_9ACTN